MICELLRKKGSICIQSDDVLHRKMQEVYVVTPFSKGVPLFGTWLHNGIPFEYDPLMTV